MCSVYSAGGFSRLGEDAGGTGRVVREGIERRADEKKRGILRGWMCSRWFDTWVVFADLPCRCVISTPVILYGGYNYGIPRTNT